MPLKIFKDLLGLIALSPLLLFLFLVSTAYLTVEFMIFLFLSWLDSIRR